MISLNFQIPEKCVHQLLLLLLSLNYYLLLERFSYQCKLMVFHWSLSNSKSPQVSRTLLSILTVPNNVVVRMVSTRPLISKFSCPFNNPFVTVPKALITIDIIVTFIFHNLFNSLARSRYLSFFSFSILHRGQTGQQNQPFCKFSFFCIFIFCWLL